MNRHWIITIIALLGMIVVQELHIYELRNQLRIEKEWARWWFRAYAHKIGYGLKEDKDERDRSSS